MGLGLRGGMEEGDRRFQARAVVLGELLKPKAIIAEGIKCLEPGLNFGFEFGSLLFLMTLLGSGLELFFGVETQLLK
ncbi:MAG: hypothetical protein HC857_04950 [Synechococcales cyanobacterium RU_4_20]|nr:hypothetical protein [Synechococcales cyanobacterium RU_4_20]